MAVFRPNWRLSQQQQIPTQHRLLSHLPDAMNNVADAPRNDAPQADADARPDDARRDVAPDDVRLAAAPLGAPHPDGGYLAHAAH